MKYKIERKFKLWAYSISHKSLVLRSEMQYEDVEYDYKLERNVTIDIEFYGVSLVNIPTFIDIIDINQESVIDLSSMNVVDEGQKVYQINEDFHIIASGYLIGESEWGADLCRIFNLELEYDKIIHRG